MYDKNKALSSVTYLYKYALNVIMRYFLCILFPPAAVLTTGRIGAFILSCILTLCLWIPGVIHAILVTNDFYESRRHRQLMREVRRSRY
jgi:uncharacterized membrane protein YqaE (UPF0057 family)